jgi:hypothetical protein
MRELRPHILFFILSAIYCSGLAQSVVINNPSSCSIGLNLTDGACDPNVNVIPDPDRVVINVNNAPGSQLGTDVFLQEVQLIITHTWSNDLDIRLKSPGGQEIPLSLDNGGGDDNYGDPQAANCTGFARLSMNSCVSIVGAQAPFTDQPYRPQGSYYDFNDEVTDPNGLWELSICDDAEGDLGRLEYVNLIFAPLNCLPVEQLEVLGQDTTSVTLNWSPANSCGTSILEYGPPGFQPGLGTDPGDGQLITINGCPPYILSGLPADTEFEIYLRKDCGNGSLSGNSCPLQFATGCQLSAPTLRSDFDALATCSGFCDTDCDFDDFWANSSSDEFDWLVNAGSTSTFGTGPNDDVSGGGNYLYLEASTGDCGTGKTAYLTSNCLLLNKQGTDSCHLSFFYHMYGDGIGSLHLQASDDGGFNWSTIWQKQGNQGAEWKKAYVSLADFTDGSTLQLRFVGQEGNTSRGDMALDEIVFYGSEYQGDLMFEYFVDSDNDGYGDGSQSRLSCSPVAPDGFIDVEGDCDDSNPNVNPGEAETPCNDIDENCNGLADDPLIPPLEVTSDTICPGEGAVVCALNAERFVFWYASPDGADLIGFNDCLFLNSSQLQNDGPVPVTYTFWAEESDGICTSAARSPATVLVYPQPDISLSGQPEICPGQTFDLNSLNFQDANFTGSSLTFHSGLPTTDANQLDTSLVAPLSNTTYFYRAQSEGGCIDEGSFTLAVSQNTPLSFMPADSFSLCRESSTNISVVPQGMGSYSYQWSNGDTAPQIQVSSNFEAGATDVYYVTVTDDEGCLNIDSVKVNTTVSIDSLRRFVTDVSSCDGSDGLITLIPLDGVSPYSYQWQGTNGVSGDSSGLADTLAIMDLPQGSYRITITDASPQACALILRSVIINGPAAVVDDVTVEDVSCAGDSNGEICISFFGGNPAFNWNTGDTTACIENLPGGSYTVTITEGECQTILEDIVVEEPILLKTSVNLTAPSCSSTSDGSIDLSVFGGTPPYSYEWSFGSFTGEDPLDIAAGDYTVTITDANDCELIRTFELNAPAAVDIALESLSNISCTGLEDGSIQVSVSGGTSPYEYEWSNGSIAPLTVNLSEGNYTLSVTDFNGCEQTFAADIAAPSPIMLSLVEAISPECVGEKDGSLQVAASGGTPPYSYSWSQTDMDSLLENLAVGTYFAYATDSNNCPPDTLEIELDAVSVLDLDVQIDHPDCVGPATGSIQLTPQGTAPFRYEWYQGSTDTTSSLSSLEVGEYCVVIEDGQGCLYDTCFMVEAPQVFGVDFNIIQPTCAGDDDGLIDVNIFSPPGVPPFQPPISYDWNDGEMGDLRIGIGDGDYVATITDDDGCRFLSDTIEIRAPLPLDLAPEGFGVIPCNGDTTGFIEVSVRGGIQPYTYNWIGQDITTEDIFNIGAGEYRLLVLDANFCPIDTTFILSEPAPLDVSISIQSEDICEGGMVEEICADIEGGIQPYSLSWSNGASSNCLSMPAPADYILSVTDQNGCTEVSNPQKVKEFTEAFKLDSFYVTNVSCHGLNDGCATAVVSGGSSNYNYHFSNGTPTFSDTSSFSRCGLSPGNYRVTVTDISTGCTVISGFKTLSEPANLEFIRDSTYNVGCFDGDNGAIFTTTSGGVMPYQYIWVNSDGDTIPGGTSDITGLSGGLYTGFVLDANNCLASISANIFTENTPIRDTLANITDINCAGDSTGAIQLTVLGGVSPYTFAWSNGSSSLNQSMLPAGTYTLSVTDAEDCEVVFPAYEVEEPDQAITIEFFIDSVKCNGGEDGAIQLLINGGLMPYEFEWSYGGELIPGADTSLLEMLTAGSYELRLQDADNCVKFYSFEVEEPAPLDLQINITPPNPPDPGSATVEVAGGTPEYEYAWNTGASEATIPIEGGSYTVTVTDNNNCTETASILIDGTYEHGLVEHLRLYPNPASDRLFIEGAFTRPMGLQLEVYDVLGQRLIQKTYEPQAFLNKSIETHLLPDGPYQILIRHQNLLLYTGTFIKQQAGY